MQVLLLLPLISAHVPAVCTANHHQLFAYVSRCEQALLQRDLCPKGCTRLLDLNARRQMAADAMAFFCRTSMACINVNLDPGKRGLASETDTALSLKTDDESAARHPNSSSSASLAYGSRILLKNDDEGNCASDIDCSLNGKCNSGSCICDRPWTGDACGQLSFRPVTMPQGYGMSPNKTTWGGNILTGDDQHFHLYVSAMTNECGLGHWSSNSRIEHAVAKRPEGPFEFVDVAVNTWAHNAAPIALYDGSYAIVHIGTGGGKMDGGRNCTPNGTHSVADNVFEGLDEHKSPKPRGSRIHVSKSITGPWLPLNDSGLLPKNNCDNPAPWQHPNGTLYVACGREIKNNLINLWRAESISGPWSFVTGLNNTFSTPTPPGKKEDVFIFTGMFAHVAIDAHFAYFLFSQKYAAQTNEDTGTRYGTHSISMKAIVARV